MVRFPHDGSSVQDPDPLKSISSISSLLTWSEYIPFHDKKELPTIRVPTFFYNILGNLLKVQIEPFHVIFYKNLGAIFYLNATVK